MAKEKSVINVAGLKKLIKMLESGEISFDRKKKTVPVNMKKKGYAYGGAGMKKKGMARGGMNKKKR